MSKGWVVGGAVIAVLGVGGAAGLPWYAGGIVERHFVEGFAQPGGSCMDTGFVVKLDKFERGLFSSKAVTSITPNKRGQPTTPLLIEHHIDNFPTLSQAVKVRSHLFEDGKPLEGVPPFETELYRDGTFRSTWQSADIGDKPVFDDLARFSLKNAHLLFEKTAGGTKIDFKIDQMKLEEKQIGQLLMDGVGFHSSTTNTPLCITQLSGEWEGRIDSVEGNAGLMGGVSMKDLALKVGLSGKDGVFGMKAAVVIGLLNGRMVNEDLGKLTNLDLEINFDRLVRSWQGMFVHDANASSGFYDRLSRTGTELYKYSPQMGGRLAFKVDSKYAKGVFSSDAKMILDGPSIARILSWKEGDEVRPLGDALSVEANISFSDFALQTDFLDEPGRIEGTLNAHTNMTADGLVYVSERYPGILSVILPDQLVSMGLNIETDQRLFSSMLSSSLSTALRDELDWYLDEDIPPSDSPDYPQALLSKLVSKRFLVEDGDRLKLNYRFGKDGIMLNGQPLAPMFGNKRGDDE